MRHLSMALATAVALWCAGLPAAASGEPSEPSLFGSRLHFEWSGYVKLDAAYDTSRTAPGEFVKWVAAPDEDEDGFSFTLNQTRLGLRITAAQETRVKSSGRVEIDLYGHVDDPDPRIRHAYVELAWPEHDFDIIIGQTSDVISPLYPSTLNYTVAWWAGNIGFRRPQIRVSKRIATAGDRELRLEGALTHNIYDTRIDTLAGEDTGLALQARVGYSFPGPGSRPVTLGLSGHRAEEKFATGDATERCDSWSANLDLALPLSGSLRLQSELWSGKSLGPYLGGIGQGVSADDFHGIHSRGGWISLGFTPRAAAAAGPQVRGHPRFNVGFSVDDVDGDDLEPGARELNSSLFGNVIYTLGRRTDLGLELSYWTTRIKERDDCDALRTQLSFIYKI